MAVPEDRVSVAPGPGPSRGSLRGLDWFIFFLADVQTGFGPFIAVYLTTEKWTQAQIGLVLSIGGVIGLIGQMPGGAIVDAARSERLVAGFAIAAIGCSALGYAAWPIFPIVVSAATLHAAASCVLGPAIAAISLGLVGPQAIGERLGRNARFASLGNGVAAALTYFADRLQMQSLSYAKGATTLGSWNYWYKTDSTNCPGAPAGNNGQIQCITDNVDSGRSVAYAYDALYRATSAVTNGSANYPKWGLSWSYDRYGNRTGQSITSGCVAPMTCPTNSLTFSPSAGALTNRPDGYSFDANGPEIDSVDLRTTPSTGPKAGKPFVIVPTGLKLPPDGRTKPAPRPRWAPQVRPAPQVGKHAPARTVQRSRCTTSACMR